MDHKRTIKETYQFESAILLVVECDGRGAPLAAALGNDSAGWSTYPVELFEQAAAILTKLRRGGGDWRYMCELHGYYEFLGSCGKCADERAAAVAATCDDIAEKAGV